MEKKENLHINEEDSLSIKDSYNKILELLIFIKLHLLKLLILGIIGGVGGFCVAYFTKPIYPGKIRFVMKESAGNSGLISSLGSLGSLIGGTSGNASPMDRTLAIMGSERIVGAALFKNITINGKSDLAINHFIKVNELHKKWEDDSTLRNVLFFKNQISLQSLDFARRKAYRDILNILIGKKSKVIVRSFDKKSGVFEQIVNNSNEDFSIIFSNLLFKELEQFLYKQSVFSSSKNVEILNNKIDSIKYELNQIQNNLARNTDRTLGLLMQEDKVDQKKLMMKEQMLTIMYGEAQKNLETFKFMNESINPGLEVLEVPFAPIKPVKKSRLMFSVFGFLISGILGFSFLYTKKWVKDQL